MAFASALPSAVATKRSNSFLDGFFFDISNLLPVPKRTNFLVIKVSLAEKKAQEVDATLAYARVLNRKLVLLPPSNDVPSPSV